MERQLDQYRCVAILVAVIPVQQVVANLIDQQTVLAY